MSSWASSQAGGLHALLTDVVARAGSAVDGGVKHATATAQAATVNSGVCVPSMSDVDVGRYLSTLFWFGCAGGVLLARAYVRGRRERPRLARLAADDAGAEQERREVAAAEAAQARLDVAFKGLLTSAMIYVGDEMNLYKELSLAGPLSSSALALRTGLHERWLREWLLQGAAAEILEYHPSGVSEVPGGSFSLRPAYERTLLPERDPKATHSVSGAFLMGPALCARIASLGERMHDEQGLGEPFDGSHKEVIARAMERVHLNLYRSVLVDHLFADQRVLGGQLSARLEQGGMRVAEVGCGTGSGLVELGRRFPKNTFEGYELSKEAIAQARNKATLAELTNVCIMDVAQQPMDEGAFDFVYCHDVIHDCAHPKELLRAVRRALKPGGAFLIVDMECWEDEATNIAQASSEVRYGISCGLCLHSGCSEPGGAQLGILGLHPQRLVDLLEECGFSPHKVESFKIDQLPRNLCYIVQT